MDLKRTLRKREGEILMKFRIKIDIDEEIIENEVRKHNMKKNKLLSQNNIVNVGIKFHPLIVKIS